MPESVSGTEQTQIALRIEDLVQEFPARRGQTVHALRGVSLAVHQGETLGVVGESGCGKSTLLRSVMLAPRPSRGKVFLEDVELTGLDHRGLTKARRRLALVFQDPYSSLDPRFLVRELVAEPMLAAGMARADRAKKSAELLEAVGLDPHHHGARRSSELSGGQLQRVAIARALATEPALMLCDEIVSALDVSVQAQILNVLRELRSRLRLTSVFVSHDLGVVRHVSDRIAVMYLGTLSEIGPAGELYQRPVHPYTDALISAAPGLRRAGDRAQGHLEGELPSPLAPPSGCPFRTRCPKAQALCAEQMPELQDFGGGHLAACHFPLRALPGR
ncbi:ATP-binding cassette domain-containing protein [Actinomadura sp. LD22]|uniref:ATP-binding cassette domain-containing protein n=1 Tax=Actinomadura physcomitrii TaxID=2650748 RepID=A0A6I4MBJ1_9ACTN|nr:oligopeptide/dipeptide ABC transporter ATP-binding protein [Actinomadura physcomitrii]MWA01604.1 ATP-binding cassette domain-containing protein [Actinomadura physcomitrii]